MITLACHASADSREARLGIVAAVAAGLARHGDRLAPAQGVQVAGCDGVIVFGASGEKRALFDAYRAAGRQALVIDKGYVRDGGYFRVAANASQPLAYLQRRKHPADRLARLKLAFAPYQVGGTHVLFDGASQKFVSWHKLGDRTAWAQGVIEKIRAHSTKPIVYRPRRTPDVEAPIAGAEFSQGPLEADFARAAVVVTYGGNLGFDAALAGLPLFVLGDSIARALAETDWGKLEVPRIPGAAERRQWAADVAWQQWTLAEFAAGTAWDYLKGALADAA